MHLDLSHKVTRKRILLVWSGTFKPNAGMFEYGKAWINLLVRQGWEIGVCGLALVLREIHEPCTKFEITGERDSGPKFYKAISLTSLFDTSSAKRFKCNIMQHIKVYQPSLVHIVDKPIYSGYLLKAIAVHSKNIIIACTIHDPKRHDEQLSIIAKLLIFYDNKRILKAASLSNVLLHVHSNKLVRQTVFEKSSSIIEMPHPLPNTITKRTRREITEEKLYPIRIGFLGRIESYKGLDVLYESVVSCLASGKVAAEQIEIVIAGRGIIKQEWDKLPCQVRIFNSLLPDQEFHQVMADIDLLVLPYKNATQSGVGMLGLAYGIPIIATNVGALNQLIINGETGYVIPPNQSIALSNIIYKLINNPSELIFMRRNCLNNVNKNNLTN